MTTFKLQPVNEQAPNCVTLMIIGKNGSTKNIVIDREEILQLQDVIEEYLNQ